MNESKCCPNCGGHVVVAGSGREPVASNHYHCPKCGPVDPVPRMAKVFESGGPLLGAA